MLIDAILVGLVGRDSALSYTRLWIAISAEKAMNPPAKLIFGRGMNVI